MICLRVGDKLTDGSVVIKDEDRLCYKVASYSKGAFGIRTISKDLLDEWVHGAKEHPDLGSKELRDLLTGKTDTDKFEYGYAGTLKKLADMILEVVPIERQNEDDVLKSEFEKWMVDVAGKGPGYAEDVAGSVIPSLSDPFEEPMKSVWHGLREALYGKPPIKRIYEITSYAELMDIYGGLDAVFGKEGGEGLDTERLRKCREWAKNPKNHNSVSAAWSLYKRFWEWKNAQNGSVDKLAIALREFKAHRNDPEWRGERGENDWTSCSVNTATREYYSKLNAAAVLAFDEAKFTELFCGVKDAQGKLVFSPMWSGCIGQGWPHIKKAYDQDRAGVLKFIADIAASDKCAKEFCNKGFQRPGGFGKSVISELLMKFHPDSCIKYGSKTGDVFKFLGLVSKDYKPDYDAAEYNKAHELATDIRDRMSKLEITQTLDNDLEPDYLTVNEFVGWVFDNKEMLQEKFKEPPQPEPEMKPGDLLTAALKLFQRQRGEAGGVWTPGCSYWQLVVAEDDVWAKCQAENIVTIGWNEFGDFASKTREQIHGEFVAKLGGNPVNHSLCCYEFASRMKVGDVLIVTRNDTRLAGLGVVEGDYEYEPASAFHHSRRVRWLKVKDVVCEQVLNKKTLTDLTPYTACVASVLRSFGFKLFFPCWPCLDAWAEAARLEFSQADAAMFLADGFDYAHFMQKFVYNPTVANTKFLRHTDEEKTAVGNFIAQERANPHATSWYLDESHRPDAKGMGPGVMLNFMMKVRPDEFGTYSEMLHRMLTFVGLTNEPYTDKITIASYEATKSLQGIVLARMHELGIGKTAADPSPADYLTVNEFAWWLCSDNNENLVKEKIMSTKMRTEAPTKYDSEKRKELKFDPANKDDELLLRLLASLRAKPFAILAGHSGTGKSRYVKKLAYMTCNVNELRDRKLPGNYLILQVKPNWHDSTDLLGYRNAMDNNQYQKTSLIEFLFRAYHFKDTPFFLCLDEMNLAPVEQYFAEFLSSMESEEPVPLNDIKPTEENLFELGCEWTDARDYLEKNGFSIPKNLFIVGTVNMDETTNQFSRKVLDRAFTIEMTDVDFTKFDGNNDKPPKYEDTIKEEKIKELLGGEFCAKALDEEDRDVNSPLIKVQECLAPTAFAIAYRFASEYTLLKRALEVFDPGKTMKLDALDQAVLMKILPRIAGEADYIRKVYGAKESEGLRLALAGKSVSLAKIATILKRADDTDAQYITFWP